MLIKSIKRIRVQILKILIQTKKELPMSDLDIIAQIDEKIQQLSPEAAIKVNEYIDSLLQVYREAAEIQQQRPTFLQGVQTFRATLDFEAVGDVDEIFNSVRDRQMGREIEFL
jgi:hypothetical protein